MQPDALGTVDNAIARLRTGDSYALDVVMGHYQHRLYRYLVRLTQEQAAAEDLFQQTWLRVMQRIGRYDLRRQFTPWLFAVARNLTIDYLRQRRLGSLDTPDDTGTAPIERLTTAERDPLEQLLEFERGAAIATAIAELPAIHREVLTLRFEEDMKLEEIAEITAIPLSTVKSRLFRALQNLRGRLQ